MSTGYIGHGTVIEYALSPDEVGVGVPDTKILQVRNITGPNQSAEEVDISNFESIPAPPGVPYREWIPGFRDAGDWTAEAVFQWTTWNAIDDAFALGLTTWRIELPDTAGQTGTRIDFRGFVNAFSLTDQYDDAITIQFGIRVAAEVASVSPTAPP